MNFIVDEFREDTNAEHSIPEGSIIGIYGQFYKLSIWYVYAHYNQNITLIQLDENYKLLENPVILMVCSEDLDFYIIDWDASYINIPINYLNNYFKSKKPLFKLRYGDIINLGDNKDYFSIFFVMNFDPVTNTFMILDMNENKQKKYYSINIGLCNYYLLSRKELRCSIINKSKEFTKKYIIDCYETLDIIDENIYVKSQMNFLFEKSYCANLNPLSFDFINGKLDTIKNDLDQYENHIETYNSKTDNTNIDNDEWRQIFTKKPNQTMCDIGDENYIKTIKLSSSAQDDNILHYINTTLCDDFNRIIQPNIFTSLQPPIVRIYNEYDDGEMYDENVYNYTSNIKSYNDFIEFSYSSEESDMLNIYNNNIQYYNNQQEYIDHNETSSEDDSNSDDDELSYCSDKYMYNNKYNADYNYEDSYKSSESELLINNYLEDYSEKSENSEDIPKINTKSIVNQIKYDHIKYDHAYLNNLFEDFYNTYEISQVSALDIIKSYDENEEDGEMPKLIPINEFITLYCQEHNTDNNLHDIPINNIVNNILDDVVKTEIIIEEISKVDELNLVEDEYAEDYIDINITDVEPYLHNSGSCSVM